MRINSSTILSYALVVLTFLSCFSPVFAYLCIAAALAIVMDSLTTNTGYETMITFTEVPAAAKAAA